MSLAAAPTALLALATALATVVVPPRAAAAQQRTVERHSSSDAEGRLIGFYSAAVSFTPVAALLPATSPAGARPVALRRLGLELAYVPRLSREQRTAGFDKPEATNLAPVFPRPRALVALPGGLALEGSWTPPVRVFGVKANLWSAALARPARVGALAVTPRIAASGGTVRGAITCAESMGESSVQDDRVYYANVCRGRESDDHFSPRHLLGDVTIAPLAASTPWLGGVRPYAGAGARLDRTRFDIGVIRADGSRDPDHPILELRAVRPYALAGAEWAPRRGATSLATELFWAPGSLLTVRALAGLDVAALFAGRR